MHLISLASASFRQPLVVQGFGEELSNDESVVLEQLGFFQGEVIEKLHAAPLGDPVTVRIGEQSFALRKKICESIIVQPQE